MCKVTGEAVWAALQRDRRFALNADPLWMQVFEPFLKSWPTVLQNLLDEPVSIETIMRARAAGLRYCLENGLYRKLVEAFPEEELVAEREAVIAAAERDFGCILSLLEAAAESPDNIAQLSALSAESQITLGVLPSLNRRNLRRFKAGELTIGELLLSQPGVFLW